jgi:starch phosphorylase
MTIYGVAGKGNGDFRRPSVFIRPWRYDVEGVTGFKVPVYFLDTDLPDNLEEDRRLTTIYTVATNAIDLQEVILGIGGVRYAYSLDMRIFGGYHMNEGHSALLTLNFLNGKQKNQGNNNHRRRFEAVKQKCIFTTHTPVPAGHDQFPLDMVSCVIGETRESFRFQR